MITGSRVCLSPMMTDRNEWSLAFRRTKHIPEGHTAVDKHITASGRLSVGLFELELLESFTPCKSSHVGFQAIAHFEVLGKVYHTLSKATLLEVLTSLSKWTRGGVGREVIVH